MGLEHRRRQAALKAPLRILNIQLLNDRDALINLIS